MHATDEEVKKERHCCSIARKWRSKAMIAETQLIIDDAFQRKAEAKIEGADSGKREPDWQIVRRRRRTRIGSGQDTDEDFLKVK